MNKATIEFRYSPDYNNDNYDTDVVDRMKVWEQQNPNLKGWQ